MPGPPAWASTHLRRLSVASYLVAALATALGLALVLYFVAQGLVGRLNGDFADNTGSYAALTTAALTVIVVTLAVATGRGLKRRRAWARGTGLATGALTVLSFPLGTAYAAYAFWVLTRSEVRRELT